MELEQKVAQKFNLSPETTTKQAAELVIKSVTAAIQGSYECGSDAEFSGEGRVMPMDKTTVDRNGSALAAHKIKVHGAVKDHGNGSFSALITLKHGGAAFLAKVFTISAAFGVLFFPLFGVALGMMLFGGSLVATIVAGGLGLLIGVALMRFYLRLPGKAVLIARDAIDRELKLIEFL